ncbi:MAG: hypothetical protein KKA67_07900, partial [Spirochaetes bacterium]|nr:hypothetical protein [Spirochaetota bacterium]
SWRLARLARLARFACLAWLAAPPAGAAPLSYYLDPSSVARLTAGEELRASSAGKDARLSLAPRHGETGSARSALAAEAPDVVVEALFFLPLPSSSRPDETLAVYNALRAVGTLEGIRYYSASRGKMRVLYERSSLIAGPDDDTPVRDSARASLPGAPEILYARQVDTTFGDNRYRIALWAGEDFVAQSSANLTRFSLGPLPVAAPGDVNVRLLVISADEGLVFYVASSAKAAILPGVRNALEASFGNRAAAAFAWFSREASEAWPAAR